MMKLKKAVATICATSAVVYGAMTPLQQAIAQEVNRPNFVTIVIDDMGYSDMKGFGGEADTPNLDELAANGTILTNFYAGSTSSPSRAMLFSGKDHHKAGMGNMSETMRPEQRGNPGYEGVLSLDVLPFPQVLKDNDYRTMMTGKWHQGGEDGDEAYYPINRGFTDVQAVQLKGGDLDFMINADGEYLTEHEHHPCKDKDGNDRISCYNTNGKEELFEGVAPGTHSTDYYTDMAIKMVDQLDSDQPFYLNISYLAPHMPMQAPKELIDKYVDTYMVGWQKIRAQRFDNLKKLGHIPADVELPPMPGNVPAWESLSEREKRFEARRMALYAAETDLLDQNVGRLVQHFKDKGIYENTVFFIYSDNGAANVGFAEPPHGVSRPASDLAALSDAEFEEELVKLGSATSWVDPNNGLAAVSSTPFRNYKGDSFDGGFHTAAFLHYNGKMSGIKSNCLHSVMDIAPTILEMAGAEYPTEYKGKPNVPMDGVSMAGIFAGNLVCNPDRWIGMELDGAKGVRQGNWKLAQELFTNNKMGLYNTWNDPFEQNDLSAKYPAQYEAMLDLYQQYAEENQVIEVNNQGLPTFAVEPNGAILRGGVSFVDGVDSPVDFIPGYRKDVSLKPMTWVSVAGEVRPASEHVGMPAIVYASVRYTETASGITTYYEITEDGIVYQEDEEMIVPFMVTDELPKMVLIPVYDGILDQEATIDLMVGYQLEDGLQVDNAGSIEAPMITVTNN